MSNQLLKLSALGFVLSMLAGQGQFSAYCVLAAAFIIVLRTAFVSE